MTNNNQPLKGLQGETVEQAAKNTLKIAGVFEQDVPGFIFGFKHGANWQSQQPTEKESATVDEMAERYEEMFKEIYHDKKGTYIDCMQAAYNMRDKEQAGAVELIKEKIENYQLEIMHEILSTNGIKNNKIRIELLTTLLAQLTK